MDDLPALWQRNAANIPQQGLTPRRSLAPTLSTMGSPFTNPQGLGSLASTVLPGMWRRASQPLPSYLLDEIAAAPAAPLPVIPDSEPEREVRKVRSRPQSADKLVIPMKQKAERRARPTKRDLIPAISTHASRRMSSQLSSIPSDVQYEPKQIQPADDTFAWRTMRRFFLVSTFASVRFSNWHASAVLLACKGLTVLFS